MLHAQEHCIPQIILVTRVSHQIWHLLDSCRCYSHLARPVSFLACQVKLVQNAACLWRYMYQNQTGPSKLQQLPKNRMVFGMVDFLQANVLQPVQTIFLSYHVRLSLTYILLVVCICASFIWKSFNTKAEHVFCVQKFPFRTPGVVDSSWCELATVVKVLSFFKQVVTSCTIPQTINPTQC